MLIVDHEDAPLRHFDVRGLLQHFDDPGLVIVTGINQTAYATATQPLSGNITPALHTFQHQAAEELINKCTISLHCRHFLRCCTEGVGSSMTHLALKINNVLLRLECSSLSEKGGMVTIASRLAHDGHKSLARDIAAENQHICLVEFSGVDKFEEAAFRTMNIGGEEDSGASTHSVRPF